VFETKNKQVNSHDDKKLGDCQLFYAIIRWLAINWRNSQFLPSYYPQFSHLLWGHPFMKSARKSGFWPLLPTLHMRLTPHIHLPCHPH